MKTPRNVYLASLIGEIIVIKSKLELKSSDYQIDQEAINSIDGLMAFFERAKRYFIAEAQVKRKGLNFQDIENGKAYDEIAEALKTKIACSEITIDSFIVSVLSVLKNLKAEKIEEAIVVDYGDVWRLLLLLQKMFDSLVEREEVFDE